MLASSLNLDLPGPSAPIIHLCCLPANHKCDLKLPAPAAQVWGAHLEPCPGETEAEDPEWETNLGFRGSPPPNTHTHFLKNQLF